MKIFGAAILVIAAVFCTQAQWRRVDSGTLAWLRAVDLINEKAGWAAGSGGTLLKTADGGRSWQRFKTGIADTIRDVRFLDENHGWLLCERDRYAAGGGSYLMRTADAGASWSVIDLPDTKSVFLRMLFLRSGALWLVGEGGKALEISTATGEIREIGLPERYLILDGAEQDAGSILLVGGGGSIYRTVDSGERWTTRGAAKTWEKLNAIEFYGDRTGWAVGDRGAIVRTSDGGLQWSRVNAGVGEDLLDVRFVDDRRGYIVGEGGTILGSPDGGVNWVRERSGTNRRIESLSIAGGRAVAVGYGGTIIERAIP